VLARELGMARSTVSDAYSQLVAAGYLETQQGAGTWARCCENAVRATSHSRIPASFSIRRSCARPGSKSSRSPSTASDAFIVEDDYDGEFRYDRPPVAAVQGLDSERVVYAGTASKTLAPGLRLAWLALPPPLIDASAAHRGVADRYAPVFDQLALAELIDSGGFDRHVRRMRLHYRRRRDGLLGAIRDAAPQSHPSGIAAGLHIVLELPPGLTEAQIVAAAARGSIGLFGLATFRHGPFEYTQALVVGYGAPPDHNFDASVTAFVSLLVDATTRLRETSVLR
jgi:DNA-binding transcriptional MocR family regulator